MLYLFVGGRGFRMRAIEELGMDIICGYCTPGLQVLLLLFYRDQGGSIQAQVLHIRSQVFSGMWKGGLSEVCRVFSCRACL